MKMYFTTFLSILLAIHSVKSSPIQDKMKRGDQVQCNNEIYEGGTLLLANYDAGGPQHTVTGYTSSKGQEQIAYFPNDSNNPLQITVRQCNSSYLGLFYSEGYEQKGFNPVKLFLTDNESLCLQRNEDVYSNNLNSATHIIIAECSSDDGPNQAKQFWDDYAQEGALRPIVVRNGKEQDLKLILSNGNNGEILATNTNGQGTAYSFII